MTVAVLGGDGWTRQVVNAVGNNFPASRLLVGECRTMAGQGAVSLRTSTMWSIRPTKRLWRRSISSGPTHPRVSELRMLYTDKNASDPFEDAYVVRDGDTVVIPRGYHPVGSAPGYRLCYTFMIAGEKRSYGAWSNDADHEWILELQSKK